jgi:hypothetical protein
VLHCNPHELPADDAMVMSRELLMYSLSPRAAMYFTYLQIADNWCTSGPCSRTTIFETVSPASSFPLLSVGRIWVCPIVPDDHVDDEIH